MTDIMDTPWLQRDSPALQNYLLILLSINGIVEIVVFSFMIFTIVRSRRLQRSVKSTLASGEALSNEQITTCYTRINQILDTNGARVSRGVNVIFKLAIFNMANVTLIALIDGYLCIKDLGNDIANANAASSSGWDLGFIGEVTLVSLEAFVVLFSTLFLVPMLQALLAGSIMGKITAGTDRRPLSHYAFYVKSVSIPLALSWSLICVAVTFMWVPTTERSAILRCVCLMGAWGSALMWLDVSFVFIYHADSLTDTELPVADAGFKKLIAKAGEIAIAVHVRDQKKPLLPVDEKA